MSGKRTIRWCVRATAHAMTGLVGAGTFVVAAGASGSLLAPATAAPVADQAQSTGQVTVTGRATALTQPADPFLGTVNPTAAAATEGMFGPQIRWPEIPLQAVLMPNGHLITFGSPIGVAAQRGLAYDDWNPALGGSSAAHVQTPSMHDYDSFCSGMQRLPDGRLIMIGGNSTMSTMIFDPATRTQTAGPDLRDQRWYASTLRLTDNRILALGGADYFNTKAYTTPTRNTGVALTPEIGNGSGSWTALTGAASTVAFGAKHNRWWYPRAYNGPHGTVVGISADQVWSLDVKGRGAIRSLGKLPTNPGVSGSSVMVRPGQVLVAGGGQRTNGDSRTATNAATMIDFTGAKTKISKTTAMKTRRNWGNLTVLANGEVLMNGGTVIGTKTIKGNAAYRAEIYNPSRKTWRTVAAAQRIRTYHSVSLLLPSGAVFTGGGGIPGPEDNMNAELYYPSYLFTKGSDGTVRWASRPTITSIAGSIAYGGRLSLGLGDGRTIASASLVSLGAVTHGYNADQRSVPLTVKQTGRTLSAVLPRDVNTMPPGSYLLQVVDRFGRPSPAQIITVKRSGAGQVTVQETQQAVGGGESGDTTSVGVVPLTVGTAVSLEPYDQWGYRVRADGRGGVRTGLTTSVDTLADRRSATFMVRQGQDGGEGTISLESAAEPGVFLAVRDQQLIMAAVEEGDASAAIRASFTAGTGLVGQFTSLRSRSTDDAQYLRRIGNTVALRSSDGSDDARQGSTFAIRPPLATPESAPPPAAPEPTVSPEPVPTASATPEPTESAASPEPEPCCRPEDGELDQGSGATSCHC